MLFQDDIKLIIGYSAFSYTNLEKFADLTRRLKHIESSCMTEFKY